MEAEPTESPTVAVATVLIAAVAPAVVTTALIAAVVTTALMFAIVISVVFAATVATAGSLHPPVDRAAAVVMAHAGIRPVDRASAVIVGHAGAFAPVMTGAGGSGSKGGKTDEGGAKNAEEFHGNGSVNGVWL